MPVNKEELADRIASGDLPEAALKQITAIVDQADSTHRQALATLELKPKEASEVSEKVSEGFEKIEALVRAQYEASVALLVRKGLYNPEYPEEGEAPILTMGEVLQILKTQLRKEQIEEILKFHKPVLNLVPVKEFSAYVGAIDAHKNPKLNQWYSYVWEACQNRLNRMDEQDSADKTTSRWDLAISEGVQELPKDPHLTGTNIQKVQKWNARNNPRGVQSTNPRVYALLQMAGIDAGEPLDVRYVSVLEDGLNDPSRVPFGSWYKARVGFRDYGPVGKAAYLRLRPSVMLKGPRKEQSAENPEEKKLAA